MKIIFQKSDSNWQAGAPGDAVSFRVYYNINSEYHCQCILASNKMHDLRAFRENITVDMIDSNVSISIRYIFFREFLDAFVNGAIVIMYHGYLATPDLNSLTITDHLNSQAGTDKLFTKIKFKVKFDFQETK
jgi:hypothetical protein